MIPFAAKRKLGVPIRFVDASLDAEFLKPEIVKEADRICSNLDGGMYLYGLPATGKSYLSAALFVKWVDQWTFPKERCLYMSAGDLFVTIKSSAFDQANAFGSFYRKRVLFIDDFLEDYQATDEYRRIWVTLIHKLYDYKVFTIVNSNFSLDDVARMLDERISSKLMRIINGHYFSIK